jgi:photosystem II stability/assembly factor-like uncharacterized protein
MSEEIFKASQASLWVQPDGPNTEPQYLGCHGVDDISQPLGDVTLFFCPDPRASGRFTPAGSFQGEPGLVTTTITGLLKKTRDYLEQMRCPGTVFVHKVLCDRRDQFKNWDRSIILQTARVTNRTIGGAAARTAADDAESTQGFDLSAVELLDAFMLTGSRQVIANTQNLTAISFCDVVKCADECGPASPGCRYGVVVSESLVGSALMPEVYITLNGGVTWTAAAADPFAAGEDIGAVVCFSIDRSTRRIIVARGSTDAGNPAEIAYSDDNGATWHLVDLPTGDGDFVIESEGLFALDQNHIWAVTNAGYICFSDDGGLTWTAQESGVLAATGWNAIEFDEFNPNYGYVVGPSNEIAKTDDGGDSWNAVTGPAGKAAVSITALEVRDKNRVWIGYSDGSLWYTEDGGATWLQRTLPVTATAIDDIEFANDLMGYLIYDYAGPHGGVLRTLDGGFTWQAVADLPTNAGLTDLHVCDGNNLFVVGPIQGATGFIGHIFPE